MKYLKLFENFSNEYLYHGTSLENAKSIIEDGFSGDVYMGDEYTADSYAYSYNTPVLIKIPLNEIESFLEVNTTLLNHYEMMRDEESDDEAIDVLEAWESSKKTWRDSLNILGSVILQPNNVNITDDNIISLY
jgi:hypothetical protein